MPENGPYVPLRLAYADPPYPGMSGFYKDHPDYAGEVDHAELIERMCRDYDGWVLHTASSTLRAVLEVCPSEARVLAWVKPFASWKKGVYPAYAWEPVVLWGGRKAYGSRQTPRDYCAEGITLQRGLTGAKPQAVCMWLFDCLGAEPTDHLDGSVPRLGCRDASMGGVAFAAIARVPRPGHHRADVHRGRRVSSITPPDKGRYGTIVADPPWDLASINSGWGKDQMRGVPYDTMPLDDIAALPVRDLAARSCHLYLWTVTPVLRHAFGIAEGWGFKPKNVLTWKKPGKGMGLRFRQNAEFILFATRGPALPITRRDVPTCNEWPRATGQHSAKPEAFLDMVETVSPGPYVELFARRARFGWDYWGNESLGTAELGQPHHDEHDHAHDQNTSGNGRQIDQRTDPVPVAIAPHGLRGTR